MKKRTAVTLVEVLVLIAVVIAVFGILATILVPTIMAVSEADPLPIAKPRTGWSTITTVDHDGHKWVEAAYRDSVDIEHHPDCQCHNLSEITE